MNNCNSCNNPSGCLPNLYSSWQKFPERKTEVIETVKVGPLCGSNWCPKPIWLPEINYIQNEQRSQYDNRFGCQKYDQRYYSMMRPGEFTYKITNLKLE